MINQKNIHAKTIINKMKNLNIINRPYNAFIDRILNSPKLLTTLLICVNIFGGALYGYNMAALAGGLTSFLKEFHTLFSKVSSSGQFATSLLTGLVGSILLLGGMIGAIVGGPLSDRMGRKRCMLCIVIISAVGTVGSAAAPWFEMVIVSRFVLGLSVGWITVVAPLYVAEMVPNPALRGTLGSLFQMGLNLGSLLAYCMALAFVNYDKAWRYIFSISGAITIALSGIFAIMPESTGWMLQRKNKLEHRDTAHSIVQAMPPPMQPLTDVPQEFTLHKARKSLADIYNIPAQPQNLVSDSTYSSIAQTPEKPQQSLLHVDSPANLTNVNFLADEILSPITIDDLQRFQFPLKKVPDPVVEAALPGRKHRTTRSSFAVLKSLLTKPRNIKGLFLGFVIACTVQFTGINALTFYMPVIFKDYAGMDTIPSLLATLSVGVANVLTTFVCVFLVDRFGRKPLLLVGLVFMNLSMTAMGFVFMFAKVPVKGYVAMSLIYVFVLGLNMGAGSLMFLLFNELFLAEIDVKDMAVGILSACQWAGAFLLALFFLPLSQLLGAPAIFWIFAGVGIVSMIIFAFLLPETSERKKKEITTQIVKEIIEEKGGIILTESVDALDVLDKIDTSDIIVEQRAATPVTPADLPSPTSTSEEVGYNYPIPTRRYSKVEGRKYSTIDELDA
jgi:MFS family permease